MLSTSCSSSTYNDIKTPILYVIDDGVFMPTPTDPGLGRVNKSGLRVVGGALLVTKAGFEHMSAEPVILRNKVDGVFQTGDDVAETVLSVTVTRRGLLTGRSFIVGDGRSIQ